MTTNKREGPSERTWRALDGLQPRHLEVFCGAAELCDLRPLDMLKVPWPLETLTLNGMMDGLKTGIPKAYRSIVSLRMDFCYALEYFPPGGCDALRHLSIRNNNALDMFTLLCSKNPLVFEMLETIELRTSSVYTLGRPMDFTRMLQQCTSTRSLHLVFAAADQLFDEIPNSTLDDTENDYGEEGDGEEDDGKEDDEDENENENENDDEKNDDNDQNQDKEQSGSEDMTDSSSNSQNSEDESDGGSSGEDAGGY